MRVKVAVTVDPNGPDQVQTPVRCSVMTVDHRYNQDITVDPKLFPPIIVFSYRRLALPVMLTMMCPHVPNNYWPLTISPHFNRCTRGFASL